MHALRTFYVPHTRELKLPFRRKAGTTSKSAYISEASQISMPKLFILEYVEIQLTSCHYRVMIVNIKSFEPEVELTW